MGDLRAMGRTGRFWSGNATPGEAGEVERDDSIGKVCCRYQIPVSGGHTTNRTYQPCALRSRKLPGCAQSDTCSLAVEGRGRMGEGIPPFGVTLANFGA